MIYFFGMVATCAVVLFGLAVIVLIVIDFLSRKPGW